MANDNKKKPIPNYLKNISYNPEMIDKEENPLVKTTSKEKHNEQIELFKLRLEPFKNAETLEEAKEILQKTMPVQLDRTTFYIGNAKCVIVNKENQLRICLDTPDELINYDFIDNAQSRR